jgi:hypothetical protein
MARVGDTLYLAGGFSRIGGTTRHRLAAISVSTGQVTRWQVRGVLSQAFVDAFAAGAGRVFLGSEDGFPLGGRRRWIVALDAITGGLLSWDPRLDIKGCRGCSRGKVCAITVRRNSVYVAGNFTHASGQRRDGFVALDAVTARPRRWHANVDKQALLALYVGGDPCNELNWGLATIGRTVYLSGGFSRINGVLRDEIAAVNARTGSVQRWIPRRPYDSDLLLFAVGGSSIAIADDTYHVRLLDRTTARKIQWTRELPRCCVHAAGIGGGRVLIVGSLDLK